MQDIFKPSFILKSFPEILKYLPATLEIALVSIIIGLLLGFIIAIIRIKQVPILNKVLILYVSFMRGTPLLVQLYLSYYGIPLVVEYINYRFGTKYNINNIPAMVFVFLAFALNESAYTSETIRGAILSVDKKEIEAGQSIGMTSVTIMRRIILPQALLVAIPNLGNTLISLVKSTSLAFTVSVMDVMASAKVIAGRNMRFFEVYIAIAIIYWVICLIIEIVFRKVEKKLNIQEREIADDRG
ncbi:amino acid ABC transporter permease [Clostridium diolis]|uniref:Amino acid ABC transporter permease n=1 Tax=Clostridium diolis TaxID=223919 RepID=A0AAV3W4N3_9CLOT|nr:amino acid ABC transporter permease [Clostridium diolis]QES74579.1 amino acid ABC transporter permease [Clostridium diolis]GEA32941.1 amino acid ABC transporter permease [Clostridium diolis]